MRWRTGANIAMALVCCNVTQAAEQVSDKSATRYSAEVGAGLEYDSNVAVDELDTSSSQSDYAATLDAELAVHKPLREGTDVSLSYDFNQNLYQEFDRVNRQTHIVGANLKQKLRRADAGLTAFYINSSLDGDGFLELTRLSPSVSGFLDRKWFGRGAYVYSDKSLAQSKGRDATTQAVEADLYFFHRGLRSYFNLGYRYRDENADFNQYDYRSHNLKLRYIHRFKLDQRSIKLELAWRFEDRDYLSDTPEIDAERNDRRQRLQVDVEVPLGERAAMQFYTGYGDYESNYTPADYNQTVTGSRVIYRW
ncbi:MAG: surface lipoprotein assembly modifier [Parahaliea sp.]